MYRHTVEEQVACLDDPQYWSLTFVIWYDLLAQSDQGWKGVVLVLRIPAKEHNSMTRLASKLRYRSLRYRTISSWQSASSWQHCWALDGLSLILCSAVASSVPTTTFKSRFIQHLARLQLQACSMVFLVNLVSGREWIPNKFWVHSQLLHSYSAVYYPIVRDYKSLY